MKKILIILNVLALLISGFWMVKSNYDLEPIVVIVTLSSTLLGMIISNSGNDLKVKGNANVIVQKGEKPNSINVEGDKNKLKQG